VIFYTDSYAYDDALTLIARNNIRNVARRLNKSEPLFREFTPRISSVQAEATGHSTSSPPSPAAPPCSPRSCGTSPQSRLDATPLDARPTLTPPRPARTPPDPTPSRHFHTRLAPLRYVSPSRAHPSPLRENSILCSRRVYIWVAVRVPVVS